MEHKKQIETKIEHACTELESILDLLQIVNPTSLPVILAVKLAIKAVKMIDEAIEK